MISTYLYISSSETSLLINIEVVITYILAYIFFKRKPHKRDYWGIFMILTGFILFVTTLPGHVKTPATILLLIAAIASCIRSIVVEQTTQDSPETTVRQKCGISGFTMFKGGLALICFFFIIAGIKFLFGIRLPGILSIFHYLPTMDEMLNPQTVICGCLAGFFLNSSSVYFFYAALQWTKSETFMAFRVFQPLLTYGFEAIAAISYVAMRPELSLKDMLMGGIILLGSFLILVVPRKVNRDKRSKSFITE